MSYDAERERRRFVGERLQAHVTFFGQRRFSEMPLERLLTTDGTVTRRDGLRGRSRIRSGQRTTRFYADQTDACDENRLSHVGRFTQRFFLRKVITDHWCDVCDERNRWRSRKKNYFRSQQSRWRFRRRLKRATCFFNNYRGPIVLRPVHNHPPVVIDIKNTDKTFISKPAAEQQSNNGTDVISHGTRVRE